MFPGVSQDAIDMLRKLLQFNPNKRMTIDQAIEHPFVASFRSVAKEITFKEPFVIDMDDNKRLDIGAYRSKLYALSDTFGVSQSTYEIDDSRSSIKLEIFF
jgi:serine/threonine protein kinase